MKNLLYSICSQLDDWTSSKYLKAGLYQNPEAILQISPGDETLSPGRINWLMEICALSPIFPKHISLKHQLPSHFTSVTTPASCLPVSNADSYILAFHSFIFHPQRWPCISPPETRVCPSHASLPGFPRTLSGVPHTDITPTLAHRECICHPGVALVSSQVATWANDVIALTHLPHSLAKRFSPHFTSSSSVS